MAMAAIMKPSVPAPPFDCSQISPPEPVSSSANDAISSPR